MAARREIWPPVNIRSVQLAVSTATLLLPKSRSWRRVILRGVPVNHTTYMGTSRNFNAASAFLIPSTNLSSATQAYIGAFQLDWPPDNEIWIISQGADVIMMIAYDIPAPGATPNIKGF